jgi:hypothetical protein
MFLLNVGNLISVIIALGISFLIYSLVQVPDIFKLMLIVLSLVLVMNIFNGALYCFTRDIADDKEPGFTDLFIYLKNSIVTSILYSVLISVLIFLFIFSFNFWWSVNNFVAEIAKVFLLCAGVVMLISSQYFFPIYAGLDKNFIKAIKKSFLIFIDNPMFSFGMFFGSILIPIISLITLFMIPGLASNSLFFNVGLKLRLYKYDYFEQHPDANPRKIPWETLLVGDEEKVGKRTLKGMIFPWKE